MIYYTITYVEWYELKLSYEPLMLERYTYATQVQVNQFQFLIFSILSPPNILPQGSGLFFSQDMHASTDTNLPSSGKTKILHALILDELIELSCKLIFTDLLQILSLTNGAFSGVSALEHSLLHHLHLHLHLQLRLCCTIILSLGSSSSSAPPSSSKEQSPQNRSTKKSSSKWHSWDMEKIGCN